MKRDKDLHDKAWNLLDEKGLKLNEKMMVRSAFVEWSGYKDENPFIEIVHKKGDIEYYHSSHEMIKHMMFKTENEVVLANAIYLNMDEIIGVNEFRELFKFTARVIGLNTEWT
tara:strand:- start:545 stop:883 length:339 start_codon:yes stop_codon:yes gene_type:complete